jgi:hypothetical protein
VSQCRVVRFSEEYQKTLASDGRVLVDMFDIMLDAAKQCKEARIGRESECWNGGDERHLKPIRDINSSIERISTHKGKMISAKRV